MIRHALILLLAAAPLHAATWQAVPAKSKLTFQASYEGEAFEGRFATFTPTVAFDAADPAKISITALVDVTSVDTRNQERDDALKSQEFFAASSYPQARFATKSCSGKAPEFSCEAKLAIRNRERPIAFPFTWTANADGTATLAANVSLNRLDFDVGTGDWADTALIPNAVKVTVELRLAPAP